MKCQGEGVILAFTSFFPPNSLRILQISKKRSWEFRLPGSCSMGAGFIGGFGEAVVLVKVTFALSLVLAVVE